MRYLIIAAVLALLAALPARAEPSGTFRLAHNVGFGAHSSLDPSSHGRVMQIIDKIMNGLVRPGPNGRPQPDLATSWEVNGDGTVWTFNLRRNVRFHDGTAFEAGDVVYTLNHVLDPDRSSPVRSAVQMISSVRAAGAYTVVITLKSTFADLPLQLMDPRLCIIPEGSADTVGHTGTGTGPFVVEKFDPDGITVLKANPDYWEGAPKLASIEVIGIPDAQARLQAFLAGQLDMERGIVPLLRRALLKSDRYILQEIPTGNWSGFVFRTDIPPFDDVRVRRAMRLVADREDLLKLALDGGGIVSCDTPVAPNDQYRNAITCPPDVARARALLADAGYPDGLDVNLYISTIDQSWGPMAVAYQQQAAAAGIRVRIIKASADGYWSEVWRHKKAFATSWGARPADLALNEAFHSTAKWNESNFRDKAFDRLIEAARNELDFDKRRALYIAAQQYLYDNAGTLIPFHVTQLVGLSRRVRNLAPVRSQAVRWHLVSVDGES